MLCVVLLAVFRSLCGVCHVLRLIAGCSVLCVVLFVGVCCALCVLCCCVLVGCGLLHVMHGSLFVVC